MSTSDNRPTMLTSESATPPSFNLGEVASPTTIRNADADINIKPTKFVMSPTMGGVTKSRRTFYDRTFTKLEKGSVRGSIFNMVAASLGGGVLTLSYVFVLSGWMIGLTLIAVGTLAGIWSNLMLAKMSIKHKLPNLYQIAFKAGGNCLRKFL